MQVTSRHIDQVEVAPDGHVPGTVEGAQDACRHRVLPVTALPEIVAPQDVSTRDGRRLVAKGQPEVGKRGPWQRQWGYYTDNQGAISI